MAWPTTVRNDAYINKNTSSYAWAQEVDSAGAEVETAHAIHPVGRIIGGKFSKTSTKSSEKDAGGEEYSAETSVAGTFEYQTAQRDKETLDIPETMAGRFARWFQELTTVEMNGKIQYLVIPKMAPDGTVDIGLTDLKPTHKWTVYPLDADVTLDIDITTGHFGAQALADTIDAGSYHKIIEMTPA